VTIVDALLSRNIFSRPGKPLDRVLAIVVHYVGKEKQTALEVREYFEGLKTQNAADKNPDRSASAHYVIGFTGQILRLIPEGEKAYHCGAIGYTDAAKDYFGEYCRDPDSSPNRVTIGIELCHPDTSGKPTPAAEAAAIELVTNLCQRYRLEPCSAVWRHYDVTAKICPKYYVDHPEEWARFLLEVAR
jgi:N-acetylmuramoyl-L-alanine amidase